MYTLFMMYETFTNGFISLSLYIFSLISLLCGIMVIISKNPIISVLFLIGLFLSIACYLIILGISFIGLSYLLVYVGAVSILFIFILMLINVRISELLSNTSNSIPLAILIPILFYNIVYEIMPEDYSVLTNTVKLNDYGNIYNKTNFFNYNNSSKIGFITDKIWDGNLAETSHITSIGNIMYSSYSMWLIITSIILLLAMVGAIVITIKQEN
uniref:NADH-ubiquinone oxidoreductase chain 6 n=1 Tax=Phaeoplaca camptidia TaxID=2488735 RepID=A0A8K1SNG3_9LECA|nr:NADH dehydrogenase subunit 6 [Phaeoplaca camptidia]